MPEPLPTDRLVIYSDYLCPFCYIGKRTMEQYLESADEVPELEWRPYDIQGPERGPDGSLRDDVDDDDKDGDDNKDRAYLDHIRRNMTQLIDEYDLEMRRDIPDGIDSWNAQKLASYVQDNHDEKTFRTLHDTLFEALWREGRDIGAPSVLVELGEEVGLGGDEARAALDDAALDERLSERFEEARDRGVFAIPTFIYRGYAMHGAVAPDQFERFLED